jgi:Leucine-rich repeat (LRR) protein
MIHEVWRALGTTLLLLSLCLSQTTYSLHQIPDTEVLALRKIYEDMNGVAWNVKNDVGIPWNFSLPDADTHPCRPDEAGLIWQRILCADSSDAIEGTVCAADNCTIVALDFSYLEGLDGVVPDEIVQLGSLRSLVAEVHNNYKGSTSFTDQHGRMPGVVGNLTTLTELKLFRFEYSSGGIPEEYSKLVNLETLHIMNCNVSGPLPAGLASLESLKDMQVFDNSLDSSIPNDFFEKMVNLTYLRMSRNRFTGSLPTSLRNHATLEILNIEFNQFNSAVHDLSMLSLRELHLAFNMFFGSLSLKAGNLESLHYMDFSDNLLSGSLPLELSKLVSLKRLLLSRNSFTGQIPDSISNLSALSRIEMASNGFSGSLSSSLGQLLTLQYLEVEENMLTSSLPSGWSTLTQLKQLRVNNNNMTGSIPNEVCGLSKLQQLYMQDNHFTSSLPPDFTNLTGLQFFHGSDNLLTGSLPALDAFQKLIFLNVSFNTLTGMTHTRMIHHGIVVLWMLFLTTIILFFLLLYVNCCRIHSVVTVRTFEAAGHRVPE